MGCPELRSCLGDPITDTPLPGGVAVGGGKWPEAAGHKHVANECWQGGQKTQKTGGVWPITDLRAVCRAATFDAKLVENGNIDEEHQDLQLCDVETFDSVLKSFQHGLGLCFTWQRADGWIACKGGAPMRVEPYSWDETRDTASKTQHPQDSLKILVGSVAEAGWPRLRLGWKTAAVSGSELVLGLGESIVLVKERLQLVSMEEVLVVKKNSDNHACCCIWDQDLL